ncbi:MAG: ABC transporter permease [Planctomycetota bacterium]
MSNKTYLVAHREYLDNVRTKSFWIGIFILPVIYAVIFAASVYLEKAKDVRPYAIVDRSGWLAHSIQERAAKSDLYEILKMVQRQAAKGEEAISKLPALLRGEAASLQGLSDEQLRERAAQYAAWREQAGTGELETSAHSAVEGKELVHWYLSLSPKEASQLDAALRIDEFKRIEIDTSESDPEERLRKMLEKGPKTLFAYFVFGEDPVGSGKGNKYVSNNRTDTDLRDYIFRHANDAVKERRFAAANIDAAAAHRIQQPLEFEEKQVTAAGQEKEVSTRDKVREWAPVVFVYALWLAVFIVAQTLLTNTIEEKSNRTIEVLLSSVSPIQLMVGKVLGIAATGLTLIATWLAFALLGAELAPVIAGDAGQKTLEMAEAIFGVIVDARYLVSFLAYFILGYLLIATILVGIGSACSSLKEAQNFMGPITIVLILPLLAMVPVSKDPNGTLAMVLSYIPPFTPFVMMNRAAGPPALWEYAVTTALLAVSIFAASWAAAKIFRVGILMTGKPPRLREILRWIWAPVGVVPERKE